MAIIGETDLRKLDFLVEKHVFDREVGDNTEAIPHYSSNEGEAWKIVENFKLWYSYSTPLDRRKKMQWNLGNDLSDAEVVTFIFIVHDGFKRHHFAAEAVRLAKAIVLAALRAKGIEVKDDYLDKEAPKQQDEGEIN